MLYNFFYLLFLLFILQCSKHNYNPLSDENQIVQGCMDINACNYDNNVSESDDSCEYAEQYYDCNGNYLFLEEFLNQDHSNSLEIVTWNIEWFPKNDNTVDTLATIIDYLDLDIIAIQEMTDSNALNSLKNQLGNNWEAFHTNIDSGWGVLAYLINTQNITINQAPYEVLSGSQYPSNDPS